METINQAWLAERGRELQAGILFLTRLHYGASEPVSGVPIGRAAWAFPMVGVIVGVIGAIVYGLAFRLGLPFWPAAALCVAATMTLTGCLHEDGLADTIDGFGGGETGERKLDIMRDSRIGTYGVCALVIAILLRVSALALIGAAGPVTAALIAAHAAGRAVMPAIMALLPPARRDGLSASAGQPPLGECCRGCGARCCDPVSMPRPWARARGADRARDCGPAHGMAVGQSNRRPDRRRAWCGRAGERDRRSARCIVVSGEPKLRCLLFVGQCGADAGDHVGRRVRHLFDQLLHVFA